MAFLTRLLEKKYDVHSAYSGEDAIALIPEIMPGLILLDVIITGISGIEACRQISENDETRDIPVIMLTSLSEADQIKDGLEAGATDYIVKLFKEIELMARVNSALRLQNSIVQLKKANATKDKFFSIIAQT